jgi:hypothetical protein
MPSRTLIVAAVFATAAALAGCDKPSGPSTSQDASKGTPSSSAGASQTQNSPANLPKPATQDEKREGANPQQGHADPKDPAQHRDFQQKGDSAGPTGPDTTPRSK